MTSAQPGAPATAEAIVPSTRSRSPSARSQAITAANHFDVFIVARAAAAGSLRILSPSSVQYARSD